MKGRDHSLRHVKRRSGIVVIVALVIFVGAVLKSDPLQTLFTDELELRVILPESGLAGLSVGSAVDVLGTSAGEVQKIVLDPKTHFYAVVRIDAGMEPFVRHDSQVFIRKQFGIAGASYLDITRGFEAPLDWDYAVLTASEETAPSDSVADLIDEVRKKVVPVVSDVRRASVAAAGLLEGLNDPEGNLQTALADLAVVSTLVAAGEGNAGRLLLDNSLARDLEAVVSEVRDTMDSVSIIVANLETTTDQVAGMTAAFSDQFGTLPQMIEETNATLESLRGFIDEVGRTMPEVTNLVRNSADASTALPTIMAQTQQTLAELEQLLNQLQTSWLLGGDGAPREVDRLSPIEARP